MRFETGRPEAFASGNGSASPVHEDLMTTLARLDAVLDALPDHTDDDPKSRPFHEAPKWPKPLAERIRSGEFAKQGPVAHNTLPSITPNPLPAKQEQSRKPSYHPRCMWTYTTPAEKFDTAYRLAGNSNGIAFTINFDATRRAAILASADPAAYVTRRIRRALRKHFTTVPQYAFAFEIDRRGKLHLHGALIPPPEQSLADPAFKTTLRTAFKQVGGKVTGYASGRPVDVKVMFDSGGWCEYTMKDQPRVRRFLDTGKTVFISGDLRRAARDFHDKVRKAMTGK